jgi:hypothetical protein
MDGRDQPDTNVVRIRRRGDPSEAERRRLASTIFAEQDDVGTFSRGNLVPPPTEPPDDDRGTADPYFENLQRSHSGHAHSASPAPADSETTAYFCPRRRASRVSSALRIHAGLKPPRQTDGPSTPTRRAADQVHRGGKTSAAT